MKTIIKINLNDIKQIISNYFDVDLNKVSVIDCGNDKGDGPYPGTGYFCHIEVEKDNNIWSK